MPDIVNLIVEIRALFSVGLIFPPAEVNPFWIIYHFPVAGEDRHCFQPCGCSRHFPLQPFFTVLSHLRVVSPYSCSDQYSAEWSRRTFCRSQILCPVNCSCLGPTRVTALSPQFRESASCSLGSSFLSPSLETFSMPIVSCLLGAIVSCCFKYFVWFIWFQVGE